MCTKTNVHNDHSTASISEEFRLQTREIHVCERNPRAQKNLHRHIMKSRWAQIHIRMAQTAAPSTSLVGKPFEWTLYEVSLDLYGPPKILPWGGKISARFFIRMVHNLPRILEGIGTSTLRLHCNGHTGMQSPLQHVLFCIYAGWPSLSPLRRSWPLRGIREHGIASRDGCYVNKTPWSIVNTPLRDSVI